MKKKCLLTAFLVGCSMSMSFAHGMLQKTVTDYMLKAKGYENFHVGTIEGYPTFDTMLAKLKASGVKKVMLMPFMFVAGDHVNNDIAGDWKKELEDNGYEVSVPDGRSGTESRHTGHLHRTCPFCGQTQNGRYHG